MYLNISNINNLDTELNYINESYCTESKIRISDVNTKLKGIRQTIHIIDFEIQFEVLESTNTSTNISTYTYATGIDINDIPIVRELLTISDDDKKTIKKGNIIL